MKTRLMPHVPKHDRLLSVGALERGDTFQLRKKGKYYTVHCQVISKPTNDDEFDRMHYTIAVSNGKMYVFDDERRVLLADN